MPPYGLYSLANTPEELLNRGYGYGADIPTNDLSEAERNIIFSKRDPAFGTLNTETGYFPAPFTGAQPFQNASFVRGDRTFEGSGFLGDVQIPSFGGSSNINYNQYNPFEPFESTGIMQQVPLDMNRFQGVSDMSLIDETTNDEQDQEYIDQVDQSNNKFGGLMDLIGNIAIPGYGFFKNIARGGLEGLKGFGRRLGQSDFAQSPTLVDYLDARSYGGRDARDRAASQNMREARAIQTQVDRRGDSTSRVSDRNKSSVTTSSAARSKGVGGGGYTASDSNRESYRGR